MESVKMRGGNDAMENKDFFVHANMMLRQSMNPSPQ